MEDVGWRDEWKTGVYAVQYERQTRQRCLEVEEEEEEEDLDPEQGSRLGKEEFV